MRNASIAMGLVIVLIVVLGLLGRGRHPSPSGDSSVDDPPVSDLEFRAEKGERHSYGEWAGITWHYFRVTSTNQQSVKLARIIVNGRSDQTECVIDYENKTLKMGDNVSRDVDTGKCGDIVQLTIVTADPPGEYTYKF